MRNKIKKKNFIEEKNKNKTQALKKMCSCRPHDDDTKLVNYYMAPESVNRKTGLCVGTGGGQTQCSFYGDVRRRVGGADGIADPALVNRSGRSSGCPVTQQDFMVDSLNHPAMQFDPQWSGLSTRSANANRALVKEYDISRYNMFRKEWRDGYDGMNSVDGFRPLRMMASDRSNQRFEEFKNAPISRRSYGSYGVNM